MGKKKNNIIVNTNVKREEFERMASRKKRGSVSNGVLAIMIIAGIALCAFAIYQTVGELKVLWGGH